jgi:hypothetical protein
MFIYFHNNLKNTLKLTNLSSRLILIRKTKKIVYKKNCIKLRVFWMFVHNCSMTLTCVSLFYKKILVFLINQSLFCLAKGPIQFDFGPVHPVFLYQE